jgi:formylmethanofuran dehydrogenase subunit B
MIEQIDDVACTVCGCVCDDLSVTVQSGRITGVERACELAKPWFLQQNNSSPPDATVSGLPTTVELAIEEAAKLLKASRSPLIYGLSRSTTEAQRSATALADKLGATIDTTASSGHAPSIMALQQVGESTCTLGEVRNRADLVIFWGCDPVRTHPRHLERYSAEPTGQWIPNGRADRHLIVIDQDLTETAKLADEFISIPRDANWQALWLLRLLVQGIEPLHHNDSGLSVDKLRELAERMKHCKFGIIFFGGELVRENLAHRTIEAMLQLVSDLNRFTRFYARRLRRYGDVAGADSVLAWQTGYPFGVNLARGYPRYNPGEFTAPELLSRGEVDCCLLVGSDSLADFPDAAIEHLKKIPVISLDSPGSLPSVPTRVQFTTAVYGVHRPGTAYRMDEVPIPLRVLLPTNYPSDGEVLESLLRQIS